MGHLLSVCLLNYSTLKLACFEAVTRGKMPKSIIIFKPDLVIMAAYIYLGKLPDVPRYIDYADERHREKIDKYLRTVDKYHLYKMEYDKSCKEMTMRYESQTNIWIYCVFCVNFVESEAGRTIKLCKKCLNCGVCHKCFSTSTTEFVCNFCELERGDILKSLLPTIGIDPEFIIPEVITLTDMEVVDINFFNNFCSDIRNLSDDIVTKFKFTEDQKKLIKIEKDLYKLKDYLNEILTKTKFGLSLVIYFCLTAFAISNFRHLVIIQNGEDDFQNLNFIKFTPFGPNILVFEGKKSKSIEIFGKASRDTFCLLFITVNDIVGIDLQNADAILNLSNSDLFDTNQISGRLMRLGMDYRSRVIISLHKKYFNILSI